MKHDILNAKQKLKDIKWHIKYHEPIYTAIAVLTAAIIIGIIGVSYE